jgi:2-phospho-L-lactate guanylyltransferase
MIRPVWAVVPAKSFANGKSRLRPVLGDSERARFAGELLEHTLSVLGSVLSASGLDGVLVATDGDDVAALAHASGAEVLRDEGKGGGLAAVVDGALAETGARGAMGAIVLMADLPRLEARDVAEVLAALAASTAVLVRDHLGGHTNALAVSPVGAMKTCFGRADSFEAHCAAAKAAGLNVVVIDNERVAFDVDAPADHARLSAQPPADGT